jgi:hypothetical protein
MNFNFNKNVFLAAGQTSPEDALAAGNYPASGSYVDVSNYEWVNVVIHQGAIHASDTPTFEVKQADANDGTLDTLDATNCKKVSAAADDDQVIIFAINLEALADDHHFLSTAVSGVTNGSYGDILYFGCGPRKAPVTQTTALLPSDNQFEKI